MANSQAAAYRRVYVWEFPVRLYHWVNALCVLALIGTGYAIGKPLSLSYSTEAPRSVASSTSRPTCPAGPCRGPE